MSNPSRGPFLSAVEMGFAMIRRESMRSSETKTVADVNTLGELRRIVASVEDWADDSRLTLKEAKSYAPNDFDVQTITLTRAIPEDGS